MIADISRHKSGKYLLHKKIITAMDGGEQERELLGFFLRIGHRAFVKKERGSRLSVFPFIDLPIRPAC